MDNPTNPAAKFILNPNLKETSKEEGGQGQLGLSLQADVVYWQPLERECEKGMLQSVTT